MAAAKVNDTVPGMDRLLQLGVVHVHQKMTRLTGNKYLVNTAEGETLFTLKESGGFQVCFTKGHVRGFHIDAVDCQGNTAFSLRRKYRMFVSEKMEMFMNGDLVTVMRNEATFMTPLFNINDAKDTPMLRIKGEFTDYEFKLQTREKVTIGSISKKFRGAMKEVFSYADDYVITFPVDLDVRYKVAVISACILIDYRYHES